MILFNLSPAALVERLTAGCRQLRVAGGGEEVLAIALHGAAVTFTRMKRRGAVADPVAEARRIREAQAANFNDNLAAIIADARSREGRDGRQVVDLHEEALKKTPRAGR